MPTKGIGNGVNGERVLWTFGRSLDLFVGGQQSGAGGSLRGLES